MKLRYLLVILIFGFMHTVMGTLFKIMHWPYASEIYIIGVFLKLLFGILLVYKLITTDKFKEFLNW